MHLQEDGRTQQRLAHRDQGTFDGKNCRLVRALGEHQPRAVPKGFWQSAQLGAHWQEQRGGAVARQLVEEQSEPGGAQLRVRVGMEW